MNNGLTPEDHALLKRNTKTLAATNSKQKTILRKVTDQLQRLVLLADQAHIHVSPGHDFKVDLMMELDESKALLRDMGRKI